MLDVEAVHKRFRRLKVLRGASVSAGRGEIVGVVGENGSGKTTLLRIVVGLLKPDSGAVAIRGSYGYCPQQPLIFDELTAEENIRYFSAAYGLPAEVGLARGRELTARLRFRERGAQPAGALSGGTRQKLNLVVSLIHDPDLLVLDEPYQGFDYESYLAFWELARELRSTGRSVVIVTHFVHDREHLSRIYRLEDGRVVDD